MMKLKVADADYYENEQGVRFIRATRLLQKHGLGTPLDGIPRKVLEKAAERGTMIHKECEDCVNMGGINLGISSEAEYFATEIMPLYDSWESEVTVHTMGMITDYAGTIDLIAFGTDGRPKAMIDIKTGKVHIGYVTKQLTLYRFAYCQMYHLDPNDIQLFVLDAKEEGSQLIQLRSWPERELMQLLSCEAQGISYYPSKPMLSGAEEKRLEAYEISIAKTRAVLEKKLQSYESFKARIAEKILDNGEIGFRNNRYSVAIIPPSERYDFDSRKFQADHPEEFARYKTKKVSVKGSVRVTELKEKADAS